ncbi:unnamed protein product [Mesocestoides corti]|uniref:Secreted protein n=1 Tax=Mesocestoides corti TaxID=53468 RepID=A0A0R3U2D3_MESCO|nr:unnamed protein product [Mesocestoides corti]
MLAPRVGVGARACLVYVCVCSAFGTSADIRVCVDDTISGTTRTRACALVARPHEPENGACLLSGSHQRTTVVCNHSISCCYRDSIPFHRQAWHSSVRDTAAQRGCTSRPTYRFNFHLLKP